MAVAAIPDEINRRIEAVLALSKRDVLLRILAEADLCLQLEQVTAAAVLAGVALEEAFLLTDQNAADQQQDMPQGWREMPHRAAHPSVGEAELDKKAVKAMIAGVRASIKEVDRQQNKAMSFRLTDYRTRTSELSTSCS